jgi:ABC-3C biological conflict system middle component
MILPTKGINADRALLSVGADILRLLDEPKTVSRLWDEARLTRIMRKTSATLSFDWFVLALDLLYALGIVELEQGRLVRRSASAGSSILGPSPLSPEPIGQ